MSRIKDTFKELKKQKRKGLAIFLTAGDPSLRATAELVKVAGDNGADVVELGVPFSDPLADGPVIQRSFHKAIAKGATVTKTFELVEKIRKTCQTPLVFMIASNLVIHHGTNKFMKDAAGCGADGLIIPDAPPEEADEFIGPARRTGLDTIMLAAPTSTPKRLSQIASLSRGFVYYINVKGVTGGAAAAPKEVAAQVNRIRKHTKLPVLAGFGVSSPAHAKALCRVADGVIIGSQAIRVIDGEPSNAKAFKALAKFVRSIRKEIDK